LEIVQQANEATIVTHPPSSNESPNKSTEAAIRQRQNEEVNNAINNPINQANHSFPSRKLNF